MRDDDAVAVDAVAKKRKNLSHLRYNDSVVGCSVDRRRQKEMLKREKETSKSTDKSVIYVVN